MSKSIQKNFLYNLCYQLLLLIIPLVVTPYVTRVLGPDPVGLYSFANSIVSYFLLFAVLGTATYGQRAVSYAQDDPEKRSRAFFEVLLIRLLTSFLTLGIYLGYAFLFAKEELTVYLILALNVVNVACDVSWFLQGMEEFGKTALSGILFRLASILLIFLFVKKPSDLPLYVLLMTLSVVLGHLAMWLALPKHLVRVKDIHPFRDFKTVLRLFLPTIAVQIYTVLDKSMIGWFSPQGEYLENGYYEEAEKIVKIALTAVTALGIVMIPKISHAHALGKQEEVKRYMYLSYRYVFLMAIPIMLGFMAISDLFSPVYFGEGYEKCAILIPIISAIVLLIGLSNVTGMQYLVPTGKENILTITVLIGAAVNFLCNLALIPFFHSIGAAVGTVVAEFCVTLAGFLYLKKKRAFPLRPAFFPSWRYPIAGLGMFGFLLIVKQFLPVAVWSLCLLIALGAVSYFVLLLVLRDGFLLEILRRGWTSLLAPFRRLCKKSLPEKTDLSRPENSPETIDETQNACYNDMDKNDNA